MEVELRNLSGNGSIQGPSLVSYEYSEDVTSLEPSTLDGGTGQVSATALVVNGDKVGNTHPDSKLLINNQMSLIRAQGGEVQFTVKQVNKNIDVVSIVGDTLQAQFNKEITAKPHGGSGYTLLTAIKYYSSLAGIYPVLGTVASYSNLPTTPSEGDGYIVTDVNKFYVYLNGAWSDKFYKLNFEGTLDEDMDLVPVNFVGWRGNVWEHLKMLAAGFGVAYRINGTVANFASLPSSPNEYDGYIAIDTGKFYIRIGSTWVEKDPNAGFEFYVNNNSLNFRYANKTVADFAYKDLSSQSISIDDFNTAQQVEVFNYNTQYKVNSVVQSLSVNDENLPSNARGVTLSDGIQVDAGETVKVRVQINASLETVNQPTAVNTITPVPYTSGSGQYVVAGSDGILLQSSQWLGEGGRVTVAITENPNEIEITVVAPGKTSLTHATDAELGFAPYRIGVEVADGAQYPSFYITGTGVFYDKQSHTIFTGGDINPSTEESAPSVDNLFITNTSALYTKGAAAAQAICGPSVSLSESVSTIQNFGETPGKLRSLESNKFRINSVSYSADGTEISAKAAATFSDFNAIWTGLSFASFTNTALNPATYPNEAMKFNEFTVIPLMEAEPVA